MKIIYLKMIVLLTMLIIQSEPTKSQYNTTNYDVGIFYMPYWYYPGSDPLQGNWKLINDYDTYLVNKGLSHLARIPSNNYWPSPVWYDEKMASVTEKQFELMKNNEIDFVIIDSYWEFMPQVGPYTNIYSGSYESVLENLLEPGFDFHGMEFGIMWANDFKSIVVDGGCQDYLRGGPGKGLEAMMTYWSQFINHPQYKKINGKPVFYIYYPSLGLAAVNNTNGVVNDNIEGICTYCKDDSFFTPLGGDVNNSDKRTKFFLERIEQLAGQELYFVAVMTPDEILQYEDVDSINSRRYEWLINHPQNAGFDAVTSYGYKYFDKADAWSNSLFTLCSGETSYHNWNYNYTTMQNVHNKFYSFMLNNSGVDYQVPVSAGWNQGPVNYESENRNPPEPVGYADPCNNYSRDPLDQAIATPYLFEQSLLNARFTADVDPVKTKNIVMLSNWNEYGEGTVIEPNHQWGGQFLDKVKNVFSISFPPIGPPDPRPGTIAKNLQSTISIGELSPNSSSSEMFNIYPNPIINNYKIVFKLNKSGNVKTALYDMEGKLIKSLTKENVEAGSHTWQADTDGLIAGIYYFILEADGKRETKKIVVNL